MSRIMSFIRFGAVAVDFAGNPRIRDGKVDIGAYQCWMTPLGLGLIFR